MTPWRDYANEPIMAMRGNQAEALCRQALIERRYQHEAGVEAMRAPNFDRAFQRFRRAAEADARAALYRRTWWGYFYAHQRGMTGHPGGVWGDQ